MTDTVGQQEDKTVIDDTSGDLRPFPWDSLMMPQASDDTKPEDVTPLEFDRKIARLHAAREAFAMGDGQHRMQAIGKADTKPTSHDGAVRKRIRQRLVRRMLEEADTKQTHLACPPGWETLGWHPE